MEPAGVIVEIMNEDGSMARLPQDIKDEKIHLIKKYFSKVQKEAV